MYPRSLPNNQLILNGHKIRSIIDLYAYIQKRTGSDKEIKKLQDIKTILDIYDDPKIAIRHSDTFLSDEENNTKRQVISELSKRYPIKITWPR